jgi:GNAT superfamily N-acetyltransferase
MSDPMWVPPLRGQQKELVGFARHPFYATAQSQAFVARRDGEMVGRLVAIDNAAQRAVRGASDIGYVGFFESIDDQSVASALFDAAGQWLALRQLRVMRGPMNPSVNYECGLLVENFERPPTFMMPYNPQYYPRLWEGAGLTKSQDLFSFLGLRRTLSTLEQKMFFIVDEATKRFKIHLRRMDHRHFERDVRIFLGIYNASLVGNWGHVSMSDAEVAHAAKGLRHLLVPELTLIAEIDGKPVGATLGLLDFNPIIKKIDGRLFPFGFLKLLRGKKKLTRLRVVSTNVLPEYRMWGVGVVLAAHLVPPAIEWGIEEGEFSWVLESNALSRGTLERANLKIEKVHRIYDKVIDGSAG